MISRSNRSCRLTGRVGHLVSENTLFYGLAGWSSASVNVNANYTDSTGNFAGLPGAFSVSDDIQAQPLAWGWKPVLVSGTTLGVEYRYTDLEAMTIYDPVGFTQVRCRRPRFRPSPQVSMSALIGYDRPSCQRGVHIGRPFAFSGTAAMKPFVCRDKAL